MQYDLAPSPLTLTHLLTDIKQACLGFDVHCIIAKLQHLYVCVFCHAGLSFIMLAFDEFCEDIIIARLMRPA